jgi:hypothetical protein
MTAALLGPERAAAAPARIGGRALAGVIVALVVLFAAAVVVRSHIFFEVGFENAGSKIDNLGFALQLATLVAGVVALHVAPAPYVPAILVVEGAICLVCHGWIGCVYGAVLLAWWAVLGAAWLGRARLAVAALLLAALNACGFIGGELAAAALVFSMMFSLRLMMYAWDRVQNDYERPPLLDYLVYMLPAPLVVVPPYMIIIPSFSGFAARIRPGLTPARLRAIGRHLAFAALFGGLRGGFEAIGYEPHGVPWLYWNLVRSVVTAAAYAHAFMALLQLHGIDERLPLVRPLLARRFVQYWGRYQVHQKDAQVFLFFTPALLRLRRRNRYVALIVATAWTMMVGNTLLHVASRYCFLPATWDRVCWVLMTNAVMTVGLAAEMCIDEWRSRHRPLAPAHPPGLLSWAITLTLAAIAST